MSNPTDPAPLGVLDLVPVASGSDAAEAVRRSIDLARRTEASGYRRYWFAEHHLNPGVAGSSPPVMIALAGAATSRIRLGSGGVQSGHRTALSVVEEFGLLDAAYPGRLDLGLGRSGGRAFFEKLAGIPRPAPSPVVNGSSAVAAAAVPEAPAPAAVAERPHRDPGNGLLIPERPDLSGLARAPRLALNAELLQQPGADSPEYADLVRQVVGLLDGSWRSDTGLDPRPVPGQGAGVEVWVLGSSDGPSAAVAGELALRFAANYHVSPATVLEAADAYRAAFVPAPHLERPHVVVSADVVVADDDATARHLAAGFGPWVHSIRSGRGAIEYPTPEEAAAYDWTDADRRSVEDRTSTQFVGSPATVVDGLRRLQDAVGADEVIVTTITHDHADRVRSYQLLAEAWAG